MRRLLDEHKITVEDTVPQFSRPDRLLDFVGTGRLSSHSRAPLPVQLSDPALTGMSRADVAALVDHLALRQAAWVGLRRYQRRGGFHGNRGVLDFRRSD